MFFHKLTKLLLKFFFVYFLYHRKCLIPYAPLRHHKYQCYINESESFKQALKTKVNDDNNNIIYDNRSTSSETDWSSLSSSDKENDSRPSSSLHGNINKCEAQRKVSGEGFQYRTINGGVIKSVVPPGKGIKVDYKVSSFTRSSFFFYSRCFSFMFQRFVHCWIDGNCVSGCITQGFLFIISGSIQLLGSQAILLHPSRSTQRRCCATTSWSKESILLPTTSSTSLVFSTNSTSMGSTIGRRSSTKTSCWTCSRCLLIYTFYLFKAHNIFSILHLFILNLFSLFELI